MLRRWAAAESASHGQWRRLVVEREVAFRLGRPAGAGFPFFGAGKVGSGGVIPTPVGQARRPPARPPRGRQEQFRRREYSCREEMVGSVALWLQERCTDRFVGLGSFEQF
jgi:hypothetical protein